MATIDWQSIHVTGMYIGAGAIYSDRLTGAPVSDEKIIALPQSGTSLFEESTAVRDLSIDNTLVSEETIEISQKAARYPSDTLADSDNFTFEDVGGSPLGAQLTLRSRGSIAFVHKYEVATVDNIGDGQHLSRVTVNRKSAPIMVIPEGSGSDDYNIYVAATGVLQYALNPTLIGAGAKGFIVDEPNAELIVLRAGTKPFDFDVYRARDGFFLRSFTGTDASISASSTSQQLSILSTGELIISFDGAGTEDYAIFAADGTFVRKGSLNTANSGEHWIVAGSGNVVYIYQGTASSGSSWEEHDHSNATFTRLIDVSSDASGSVGSRGWYDPTAAEFVALASSGAASRRVLRYRESDGVLVFGPTQLGVSNWPGSSATFSGGGVDATNDVEYLVWNGREVWQSPRATYGSLALLYDTAIGGGVSTRDVAKVAQATRPLPGYFGGVTLTNRPVVENIGSGLDVAGLNFALVLHDSEEPVTSRYTTWGMAAQSGVLYQTLGKPNRIYLNTDGIISVLEEDVKNDSGQPIPLHYRSGPEPQPTSQVPVHVFRRFSEIEWETSSDPPPGGWLVTLEIQDADNSTNVHHQVFTQFIRKVRRKVPLRARQVRIDIKVDTSTNYDIIGTQLKYQNTARPLRGLTD